MRAFKTVILRNGVFQLQDGSLWLKDEQIFPWTYTVDSNGSRPAYLICFGWVDKTTATQVLGQEIWSGAFYSILLPLKLAQEPNPIRLNYDDFEIKVPLKPVVVFPPKG